MLDNYFENIANIWPGAIHSVIHLLWRYKQKPKAYPNVKTAI